MERRLGITEARRHFAKIVEEVKYRRDKYIIVRHGEPAAAVVPIEVYRQWQQEREVLFDTIRSVQAENEEAEPEDVLREVLEAQQAVRQPATK